MFNFVALLGNTPPLSLLELKSHLGNECVIDHHNHLAFLSLDNPDSVSTQLQQLGGTFKFLEVITPLPVNQNEAQETVVDYLSSQGNDITFGIINYYQDRLILEANDIKKALRKNGVKVRYLPSDDWGLSSAILSHHQDIIDLLIIFYRDELFLLRTMATQTVDEWVVRDRQKPYASGKKGMLPPKVARMMVNIGLGNLPSSVNLPPVVYDPFCGSGTVLMEAMLRGCRIIGSDIDKEAVEGTSKNMRWLQNMYKTETNYEIFELDATQLDQRHFAVKPDLIVTEPFLGKPNPKAAELSRIFQGLEALYMGAFRSWIGILNKGAIIVMVFPLVWANHDKFQLLGLIDKIKRFGYTLLSEPVEYSQPHATVKRQILVFRYH